ncbi:hypothetical protein [Paenibacillus sp. y28]|uniref:hypothetical protein n=1 Tax=Paenibacillus sp. y28 TaxID=3129110 RepID=UPI003019B20B
MAAYIQAGIILAFMVGFGWYLVKRTLPESKHSRLLWWVGCSLLLMAVMFVVFGLLSYLAEQSHSYGH